MKFLADSNVEGLIVEWLRAEGHDIVWAAELAPGITDTVLLELARNEARVLVSYDLDFGELVYRRRLAAFSVVLMRFSSPMQAVRLELLKGLWPSLSELLEAPAFFMLTDNEIRFRPLPINS